MPEYKWAKTLSGKQKRLGLIDAEIREKEKEIKELLTERTHLLIRISEIVNES